MGFHKYLLLLGAAFIAGAVNAVAGGGTLLTFPALLFCGELANVANATSTVALWPGICSSLFGYRKELSNVGPALWFLGVPSLIGGGLGALLFAHTNNALFSRLVPYLIFMATLLFMAQSPLSNWIKRQSERRQQSALEPKEPRDIPLSWYGVSFFQFFIALYGGYFGAGIGILMLAGLSLMGFTNIHLMNALKNINAILINFVAILVFMVERTAPGQGVGPHHDRLIHWPIALLMMIGSIAGGYLGADTARRMGQQNVRRLVIVIGFLLTLWLLVHPPGGNVPTGH